MWLNRDYQIKVAAVSPGMAWFSFSGDTHSRPVLNPGRNLDLKPLQTSYHPGATAYRAWDVLYPAGATTARTRLFGLKIKDTVSPMIGLLQSYLNRGVYIPTAPWPNPTAGTPRPETLEEVTKHAV
jgi:hypothetical protein